MSETILDKIVADKRLWLSQRQLAQPLAEFEAQLQPSQRNFYAALASRKTAFILECKKASPSKGLIREEFDPVAIATSYRPYASVISVLTDEKYFQGDFSYLPLVSQAVSQPVLCKDFIIDPYQIKLARHYQADAVLLMLSVLDDQQYIELAQLAQQLNMGVLTEVSTEAELERALALKARVIGVNNRNLRDLSIDLNRTIAFSGKIPEDVVLISESGIHSFAQIQQLRRYANGFLIGSSLMQADNLDLALRELLYGRNKVCGLTRVADAQAAAAAGAVYGGLIFAADSPRQVTLAQAQQIMQQVPQLNYVGVFRQPQLAQVVQLAQQLALTAVQLHGSFSQAQIDQLRQQLPSNCQIWLALSLGDELPARDWRQIDYYVFDNALGGSGKAFDWRLLATAEQSWDNVILAGGLSAANCQAALQLGCAGLDFNSGVESSPGIKDQQAINAVFKLIYEY